MSTTKRDSIFLLSWLSNLAFGKTATDLATLQSEARDSLKDAFTNYSTITNKLSSFWPTSWGAPVPSWDITLYSNQGASGTLADNAMYVIQGQDPDNTGNSLYVIAVAGTNVNSSYGWFTEDMDVGNVVLWNETGLPSSTCSTSSSINPSSPYISQGTCLGINTSLNDMTNDASQNLTTFLTQQIKADGKDTIEIAVAGHSLGGAISPALALALKQFFAQNPVSGKTIKVSAWPTAGPTPGNDVFAGLLASNLDEYYSVANSNDIVPHAWQASTTDPNDPFTMDQLCSIYSDLNITTCNININTCNAAGPLSANILVSGLIEYTKSLPAAGMNYTRTSDTDIFQGEADDMCGSTAPNPNTCASMIATAATMTALPKVNPIAINLQKIMTAGGGGTVQAADALDMLTFLSEAGHQHVTSYLVYFFGDTPDLITDLQSIAPGLTDAALVEALASFYVILSNAAAYLDGKTFAPCS